MAGKRDTAIPACFAGARSIKQSSSLVTSSAFSGITGVKFAASFDRIVQSRFRCSVLRQLQNMCRQRHCSPFSSRHGYCFVISAPLPAGLRSVSAKCWNDKHRASAKYCGMVPRLSSASLPVRPGKMKLYAAYVPVARSVENISRSPGYR